MHHLEVKGDAQIFLKKAGFCKKTELHAALQYERQKPDETKTEDKTLTFNYIFSFFIT